jgi:hypothetical protein
MPSLNLLKAAMFCPGPEGFWGLPLLLWGDPGCLAAGTHLSYQSRGPAGRKRSTKGGTIERLYQVFHRVAGPGSGRYQIAPRDSQFFVPSMTDDGRIFQNRVTNVIFSGRKRVFRLKTRRGFEIEATADHKFFVGDGYTPLADLCSGDTVYVHANTAVRHGAVPPSPRGNRAELYVKAHPVAPTKIVGGRYIYKRLFRARAAVEAHMNGLSLDEFVARLDAGKIEGLRFLRSEQDVHHRDEDSMNDALDNLEVFTHAQHARVHGHKHPIVFMATPDVVESIEERDVQDVYDISVADPYRNFVANGFVVHNCGKTAMVKQLVRSFGLPYQRLSPAERGEGQFGVVPVPDAEAKFLRYPPPDWARDLADGGLIFLDEINTAVPALQAPLLGAVQLRTIGSHVFGPRTRVIGAANLTADAAGGWDLAISLRNRFGHLDFQGLSPSEWVVGFLSNFQGGADERLDAVKEEARVMHEWPAADAFARGLVGGFIQRRPDLLHKKPKKGDPILSWPSRRTWDYAATALASARVHHLSEIEGDELVSAFVGAPVMAEFATWRANADLPDPVDVLDEKVKFVHDARRLDRTLAVLSSCAALVIAPKADKRKERSGVLWTLLGTVLDTAADCAIPAARALVINKLLPTEHKAVLHKIQPMLAAAGIR